MRSSFIALGCLVALSACAASTESSESTDGVLSTSTTVAGKPCAPNANEPWRGMAAITEDYQVRVWNGRTDTPTELPMVGDDPRNDQIEGDINVVETVAVDAGTCKVFVGTCCEPVSGVTYYDIVGDPADWKYVMGHYPSISPDGTKVAFSGYEEITIATIDDPTMAIATLPQPKAEVATIYDMTWLNDDELVLLGFTSDGAYLWKVSMAQTTPTEPVLVTDTVSQSKGDIWSVGLVGVDLEGKLLVRVPSGDVSRRERRDPMTLSVISREPLDVTDRSYRVSQGRIVRVSRSGGVEARLDRPGATPWRTPTIDAYVWAG